MSVLSEFSWPCWGWLWWPFLSPWSTPVLFTFCRSWTWRIETSHGPPTTKGPSLWNLSKSLSKPSCLWGKHTDYCIQLSSPGSFPFCPERGPFRSHTAAIFRCHWSCSFPADHRVFGQFLFWWFMRVYVWMIEAGHCENEATVEFTFLIQDAHLIRWCFWSLSASTDDFRGCRERMD